MEAQVLTTRRISPITAEVEVHDGSTIYYFRAFTKSGALRKARMYLRNHNWTN